MKPLKEYIPQYVTRQEIEETLLRMGIDEVELLTILWMKGVRPIIVRSAAEIPVTSHSIMICGPRKQYDDSVETHCCRCGAACYYRPDIVEWATVTSHYCQPCGKAVAGIEGEE